ncbi:MAG TPA: UvrD-helicase domain-containing protein [Tepidisphaeraceae bacterium]|nr:UvrD-helicase domain-containing protein [Tepidisphaeraceae bacterium]
MATKAKKPTRDRVVKFQLPPKPVGTNWTDEQWAGIATTGQSLLVSAAAGSGKTAVLAARCAYLVCDAEPACDVDELLVVTFTEAAAAEMKSRIERALHERLSRSPDDRRLSRQLALIDRAQVSTLHGFCAKLIRQHFHLLGLDPAFTVLDGDEAALLRLEVARELFAEQYEAAPPRSEQFQALVDAYAEGNDERLVAKLIDAHELLGSLVDPQQWLTDARRRLEEVSAGKPLEESELGRQLVADLRRRLAALAQQCDASLAAVSRMDGFAKYVEDLKSCRQIVAHWQAVLQSDGLDALAAESEIQLPKLPTVSNATPGKETAKALVELVRDEIKCGPIRQALRFTTAQWIEGIASVRPHAELFLDLVQAFGQRYQQEKSALRGVDFTDLERLALKALRDGDTDRPSSVARLLHRQFAHVLVDEYQDINEVQDGILRLASRECVGDEIAGKDEVGRRKDEEEGKTNAAADGRASDSSFLDPPSSFSSNLFCVGDVKQSIYGFRLAEPARFLARHERFREGGGAGAGGGMVVDLQANFRSRAPLLDVLNQVFTKLMTKEAADLQYDHTHELRPGLKYPAGDGKSCFAGAPVELHLLPHDVDADPQAGIDDHGGSGGGSGADAIEPDRTAREALLVARLVRQMTGADGGRPMCVIEKDRDGILTPRPIRRSDIVVLLRSMRYKGDDYAEVLRGAGIPTHSESGSGYFDSMEVRDVLALLKVLDNRRQDIPLAGLLRSPLAALPDAEDALARVRLAYDRKEVPFHQAVVRYAKDHDDELAAKLRDVLAQLDGWRDMAQRRPLAELIWDVYDSTGYLAFCAGLRDGEQRKANLIDLHERARQFGSFQRQGLARFLAFLDRLREESDLGQPSVASEGEDVVRIMTIHRSKGLEFPVVILPDLGKAINVRDCSGPILLDRHGGLGMEVVDEAKQVRYPSLASKLVSNRLRQQAMAEELRVLYVAMTRAKEHLVLIGTCREAAPDTWAARWASHGDGPLPADAVVGARCMLDWLGPVATILKRGHGDGEGAQEPIRVVRHASDDVAQWPTPESMRPSDGERQRRLARLEPLDPPPPPSDEADRIIARLTAKYPHQPFTRIQAAEAATALAKHPAHGAGSAGGARGGGGGARGADGNGASASEPPGTDWVRTLELPRAVRTEVKPSAADVGSATHLALQHLDFDRPCDIDDLKQQVQWLADKRLIAPAEADHVDLESLCWLVGSAVGQLIRAHAKRVRRELPVYFPLPANELDPSAPASGDPEDCVMVRSRIDVLVPTPAGLEIVDYKTDRVTPETVAARVERYKPQMELYRRAVKGITGQSVSRVHLVFLSARMIHSV